MGVGSFTYVYLTRDSCGWALKGAWFETVEDGETVQYDIYKDPATDDGTKKSLKGLCMVYEDSDGDIKVKSECTEEEESTGLLRSIYKDGEFLNQVNFDQVREKFLSQL